MLVQNSFLIALIHVHLDLEYNTKCHYKIKLFKYVVKKMSVINAVKSVYTCTALNWGYIFFLLQSLRTIDAKHLYSPLSWNRIMNKTNHTHIL